MVQYVAKVKVANETVTVRSKSKRELCRQLGIARGKWRTTGGGVNIEPPKLTSVFQ